MRARFLAVVVAACIPIGSLTAAAHAAPRPMPQQVDTVRLGSPADGFRVIGHRGDGAGSATENTIASMDAAAGAGATAVELDLRVTADDRFVVMHDAGLGRTTTCHGQVRARTLRWIQDNCRGRRGAEPVPSLTDVLAWARAGGTSLLVELKPAPGWSADRVREVVGAIAHDQMGSRTRFLSFSPDLLALVERVDPAMRTHLVISGSRTAESAVRRFDGVNVDPSEATREMVTRLHGLGLTVLGRTSNHPDDWRRYWTAGVDGFLTDQPGLAASLAAPSSTGGAR